jgi:hypothetical protein
VCFCSKTLNEEKPYWETFFEEIVIENAQDLNYCQDANGAKKKSMY